MRELAKIGDLATYVNGYAFKPSDWSASGRPIIRIQDLTGNDYETHYFEGDLDERYKVRKGDLLISWSASIGVYEWKQEEAWLNQHIFKVVFDKGTAVEKKYFQYAVGNALNKVSGLVHGSTMKHLTKSAFDSIQVPIYSPDIQREIVRKLEAVQHGIDILILETKKLDTLVKSRFVEMLGDPVTNPMGWEKKNIGEITDDVKYGTSAKASDNGKYKYLRMNNLTYNGYLDLSDLKQIDISDEEVEKYVVRKGDVLFNRTNSTELVGKTALFDLDEDMIIAGYIIRVRLQESVSPVFFTRLMNLKHMKKQLRAMAKGAVNQANINAQELKSINVYVPPIALQNQFADFVAQADKSKLAIRKLLERQELLRAALMQEYFG